MATLTPTLTLVSTDATADALSISVTDSLTITNPAINVARQSVATSGQFNILTTSNSSITYVYVKNMDSSNIITLKADDGTSVMDLGPEEFAFFPVKGGVGLEATANTSACVLEYGYWTKS